MKKQTQYFCCKFLLVFRKSNLESLPRKVKELIGLAHNHSKMANFPIKWYFNCNLILFFFNLIYITVSNFKMEFKKFILTSHMELIANKSFLVKKDA